MGSYEAFMDQCKQSLNSNGINLAKNQKYIIQTMYELADGFSSASIHNEIMSTKGQNIPPDIIDKTLSFFKSDEIIDIRYINADETIYSIHSQSNEHIDQKNLEGHLQYLEAYIVHAIETHRDNHEAIIPSLKNKFHDLNEMYVHKIIDAYSLLINSPKIDIQLKEFLHDINFIDKNPSLILTLAKLFFNADQIIIKDGKVVISKEVVLPSVDERNTPDIDEKKVILQVLKKLKYNRLQMKDIEKINELGTYSRYKNLHSLLQKSIDRKALIAHLKDEQLHMSEDELKDFLES